MDEQSPQETDAAQSGRPKRWRDDALSIFLIIAAFLLGAMYLYDQWQASRLEEQMARAHEIGESFAIAGADCECHSAGLAGESLVVECAGLHAERIAIGASELDSLTGELIYFDEVVFRGVNGALRCQADPATWPDGCEAITASRLHE